MSQNRPESTAKTAPIQHVAKATKTQQKPPDKGPHHPGNTSNPPPLSSAAKVRCIYLKKKDIDEFRQVYLVMVDEAQRIEASSKNLSEIANANYQIYLFMNSFLDKVRKNVQIQLQGNSDLASTMGKDQTKVTLLDLHNIELESSQRLMRAIVARNAITTGIGDTLIASVSQKELVKELEHSLAASEQDNTDNDDEAAEERDPLSVNLSNSKGLYSFLDSSEAFAINDLIGYQNEARELLSYCINVQFVNSLNPKATVPNRNPTCVVLYGPPGSGKTTIAQAVARQLNYLYMYVNAENVMSSWAGGTEKNIATLFRRARIASKQQANRRVLMLIDEADGLLKNRSTAMNMTGEEYNRITTFLQMLTPPVGIDNSAIVVIFTSNLLQNIDSAIINRCRGRLFMGYIVQPKDRFALMQRMFSPYFAAGSLPEKPFAELAIHEDHLVPRDYQNMIAQIKNVILQKYHQKQGTQAINNGHFHIDLAQKDLLLTTDELKDILAKAEPATRASTYISQYKPPPSHICTMLKVNPKTTRSYAIFWQYAQQEGLACV